MSVESIAVHEVIGVPSGRFVRAFASAAKAAACAERIGAEVVVARIAVGERVGIRWHSHPKVAEVVAIVGASKVRVRFVPRIGAAPVEREVAVAEVERRVRR